MSDEKRWTPGPWAVGMRNGSNANMVMARDGVDRRNGFDDSAITQVYGIAINKPLEDVKNDPGMPNAHLIATGPELYDDLEYRLSQTECGCGHPACNRCSDDAETRRILAKARGENHE